MNCQPIAAVDPGQSNANTFSQTSHMHKMSAATQELLWQKLELHFPGGTAKKNMHKKQKQEANCTLLGIKVGFLVGFRI